MTGKMILLGIAIWIWCGIKAYRHKQNFYKRRRILRMNYGDPNAAFIWDWSFIVHLKTIAEAALGPIAMLIIYMTYSGDDHLI